MNAGRILTFILAIAAVVPVYAASKYERTIDGKTKVLRNPPERGAQASWTGDRDEKGYATGSGTLTWFRVSHSWETGSRLPGSHYAQVSQYTGKMVEGKLEGQVVVVDAQGRTFHTKFSEGEKAGEWLAGAPNKRKESTSIKIAEAKPRPSPAAAPVTTGSGSEPLPPAEAPPPAPKLDQHVARATTQSPDQPPDATPSERPPSTAQKSDSSLRTLAMPPSSLRVASLNEPSPAPSAPAADAEETVVGSESASPNSRVSGSSPKDDDARVVAALDSEYHAAVKTNDASTMDRILADDFVFVSGAGPKLTKQDVLNKARTNQTKYERHEVDEGSQNVRVWKDTAVVTETLWVKGSENGNPVDQKISVTETYARTPDGWRYVSGQAVPTK